MVGSAENTPCKSSFLLLVEFFWLIFNSKDVTVAANSLALDRQRVCYSQEVCFLERIWGVYWFSLCSQWATGKLLTDALEI